MSRAERDKHLEHEGYETWDPNCRRCIEWGPVSDNAETREALRDAIAEALYEATEVGGDPEAMPYNLSGYQDELYRQADAVLALLPETGDAVVALREAASSFDKDRARVATWGSVAEWLNGAAEIEVQRAAALPPVAGPEVRPDETLRGDREAARREGMVAAYRDAEAISATRLWSSAETLNWLRARAALASPAPAATEVGEG